MQPVNTRIQVSTDLSPKLLRRIIRLAFPAGLTIPGMIESPLEPDECFSPLLRCVDEEGDAYYTVDHARYTDELQFATGLNAPKVQLGFPDATMTSGVAQRIVRVLDRLPSSFADIRIPAEIGTREVRSVLHMHTITIDLTCSLLAVARMGVGHFTLPKVIRLDPMAAFVSVQQGEGYESLRLARPPFTVASGAVEAGVGDLFADTADAIGKLLVEAASKAREMGVQEVESIFSTLLPAGCMVQTSINWSIAAWRTFLQTSTPELELQLIRRAIHEKLSEQASFLFEDCGQAAAEVEQSLADLDATRKKVEDGQQQPQPESES